MLTYHEQTATVIWYQRYISYLYPLLTAHCKGLHDRGKIIVSVLLENCQWIQTPPQICFA